MDDLFSLGPDMVLNFGRKQEELNLVLLIPKTETRAHQEEVTINKVMANRIPEPFLIDTLAGHFNKKNSNNIKKLRIRYEVFALDSAPEQLLMSGVSGKISDSASREHGILDFTHATPLSSCERGGRKVFVISQGQIAPDVEPRFQVRDRKTLMNDDARSRKKSFSSLVQF